MVLLPKIEKIRIINTTYELDTSGAGLCCADPISVFKLKGQVNAKEGVNIYTAQSAFLRVLMKKHNISTYGKDLTLAGSSGLEEDFGLGLTGQLKK